MAAIAQAGLTITTVSSGTGLPIDSNWLPLTTPVTLPAGCTDHWIAFGREGDNSVSMSQPSTCTPDATSIHSPGTCMDGYYVARIVEYRTAGYKPGDERLWGANCCRNDMTSSGEFAVCTSYFTTPITAYKRRTYVYTNNNVVSTSVHTAAYDNTTVYSVGNMYMPPFVVLWQSSDLSKFDVDYASSLAAHLTLDFTPTPTASVTPATASPPSRSSPPSATGSVLFDSSPTDSGLSTGAKAGIGVGAAIGALFLCLLVFILYKQRLRKRSKLDRNSAIQNEQPELRQTNAA